MNTNFWRTWFTAFVNLSMKVNLILFILFDDRLTWDQGCGVEELFNNFRLDHIIDINVNIIHFRLVFMKTIA